MHWHFLPRSDLWSRNFRRERGCSSKGTISISQTSPRKAQHVRAPLAAQAAVHPQGFCCEPLHTTRCRSDCFLHCSNNGAGLWQARSIGEKVTPYTQQTPDIIRTSSPCKSRWDRISLPRVTIKESGPPRGRLLRQPLICPFFLYLWSSQTMFPKVRRERRKP